MAQVLKGARLQVANLCGHFLRFFLPHMSQKKGVPKPSKKGLFFVWLLFSHQKNVPWRVFPVDLFPCLNQS